jgi:hypothetical protein
MNSRAWLFLCLATAATACGESTTSSTSSGEVVAGYLHTLGHSRFIIGDVLQVQDSAGFHRVVGSVGTFSTLLASQAVYAVPHHVIPELGVDYFPNDSGQQDTEVKEYLISAGVPRDQVVVGNSDPTVHVRIPIDADGGVDSGSMATNSGWFSMLNRLYHDVPITDSFAWAILDATGASVEEQVYWPTIGTEVVAKLRAFQKLLADPKTKAEFLAYLPDTLQGGQLVIHHTRWSWTGDFTAVPCYRATLGSTIFCFDILGNPVMLSDE